MKIIKNIIFLIIAFLCINSLYAVNNNAIKGLPSGSGDDDITTYRLKVKHKVNSYYRYKLTEITEVKRLYSDSSTKDYKREVVYFLTAKVPESPLDGFQTLLITVDSLIYNLNDGGAEFYFNARDLSGNAAKLKDLANRTSIVGREFEFTYSAYGDIAKIGGKEIDFLMRYIKESENDSRKPLQKFFWVNGYSNEHLSYIADMQKIVFPSQRIAKDSIWFVPLTIEINGISFYDTVSTRIINYNAGTYEIEGKSQNITPFVKNSYIHGINKLTSVDSCEGEGMYLLDFSTRGIITFLTVEYNVKIKIKVANDYIQEEIKSKMKWERLETNKL